MVFCWFELSLFSLFFEWLHNYSVATTELAARKEKNMLEEKKMQLEVVITVGASRKSRENHNGEVDRIILL